MSKWKWIAQDEDGVISKFSGQPNKCGNDNFWERWVENFKEVRYGKPNPNWKETRISLKTEDYEIVDGILKRLPRKTKLDELIARVKLIDKKAAKWINKNRHLCGDHEELGAAMPVLSETPQGLDYWISLRDQLESPPTPPKQTVRYRVSLHKNIDGTFYTHKSEDDDDERSFGSMGSFVEWLTDWIEVKVR